MWQEHERWRQKMRVVVFIAALSMLLIAWWRVASDPRSLPSIFSVDGFFGEPEPVTRPGSSLPAPDGSNVRSGAPPERSTNVGSGRGTGSGPRANRVGQSGGGREMAAGVADEREPSEPDDAGRGQPGSDCVPNGDGTEAPARGRRVTDGQPCDPVPEPGAAQPAPTR